MSNDTDHIARITEIKEKLSNNRYEAHIDDTLALLARVSELEATANVTYGMLLQVRKHIEQATADLASSSARVKELEAERDALRAEVARLGPEQAQQHDGDGRWRDVQGKAWASNTRTIRVVQQEAQP